LKFNATKNNEYNWTHFKQFKKNALVKEYLSILNQVHLAMDIQGVIDIFCFNEKFGNIENSCQMHLQYIRNQPFYHKFLFNNVSSG